NIARSGAAPPEGSIWIQATYLRYGSQGHGVREVGHRGVKALGKQYSGALWIEGERIHWVDESTGHVTQNHSDSSTGYSDHFGSHSDNGQTTHNNSFGACTIAGGGGICYPDSVSAPFPIFMYWEHSNTKHSNVRSHANNYQHTNGY